jgi:UPF0755 protein
MSDLSRVPFEDVTGGRPARGRGARVGAVVLGLLLVTAVGVVLWPGGDGGDGGPGGAASQDASDGGDDVPRDGDPVGYVVEAGATVTAVGSDLLALGVIDSSLRFRVEADAVDLARVLRPGRFQLALGMEEAAAVAVLAAGPAEGLTRPTVTVTIIEGMLLADTLAAVAAALPDVAVADLETVLDATRAGEEGGLELPDWWPDPTAAPADVDLLEGLLWPETYELFADATPRAALQRLVDQTVTEMARIADGDLEVLGAVRTRHELLTIASLIERETQVDTERALVSGVIHGRLQDGMRLDIDATLSYAKGDLRAVPLAVDRERDHPYNTYRIPGLPPGPISGVGRASLEAAADPEVTSLRFYVLAPACDGSQVFAETLSEHSRNVAAFRAARDAGACE